MNAPAVFPPRRGARRARPKLRIGLVNNMPDAALASTERQFGGLVREAAEGWAEVEFSFYALAGQPRGERARSLMAGRYQDAKCLEDARLDALIVTGCEPRAPDLDQEPYWPDLAAVVDLTEAQGLTALWSCLGAHAAVLRLDGVRRQPLPTKLSGVFQSRLAGDDPLLAGAPARPTTPHSRQNGLAEADLVAKGYRILTRSPEAGVDAFVRRAPGEGVALFLQGHPEYDAETLMREYRRDVGRFLRGERPRHPATPAHYLPAAAECELLALAERAVRQPSPELMPLYAAALSDAAPRQSWRSFALSLYRNWLAEAAGLQVGLATAEAQPAL